MPLAAWLHISVALCSPAACAWAFASAAPCAIVRPTALESSGTVRSPGRSQPFQLRQDFRPPRIADIGHRRVGDAVVAAQRIAQDLLGVGRTAELLVDQREVVADEGLAGQIALRAIERAADAQPREGLVEIPQAMQRHPEIGVGHGRELAETVPGAKLAGF